MCFEERVQGAMIRSVPEKCVNVKGIRSLSRGVCEVRGDH